MNYINEHGTRAPSIQGKSRDQRAARRKLKRLKAAVLALGLKCDYEIVYVDPRTGTRRVIE